MVILHNLKKYRVMVIGLTFYLSKNNTYYGMGMNEINVLGWNVENTTKDEILRNFGKFRFLIPINVDVVMKLNSDRFFFRAVKPYLNEIKFVNDSQVINFATKIILRKKLGEKISGSDFLPWLCSQRGNNEFSIFLLGGMGDSATLAQTKLNLRFGAETVVGSISPTYGFDKKEEECENIINKINQSGANVLAIGVGAPKQEMWMLKYANKLPDIKLFIAVGATIDFEAGKIIRSPKWISKIGLEWLFRLILEPRRLVKRYLVEGPPFFWLLLKQRLGI